MKNTRRTYTSEFKLEATRLSERSGKGDAQIEQDLGIGSGCLSRWKQKFAQDDEHAFPGRGRLTPEQEQIRQLDREAKLLRQERDILKSSGHLHTSKPMRFQLIDEHRDELPVTLMCKALNVSPSGYYAWRQRPPSAREMANQELYEKIEVTLRHYSPASRGRAGRLQTAQTCMTVRTLVESGDRHAGPHPASACLSYASRRDRNLLVS